MYIIYDYFVIIAAYIILNLKIMYICKGSEIPRNKRDVIFLHMKHDEQTIRVYIFIFNFAIYYCFFLRQHAKPNNI